jgi:hypothetical protein
MVLSFLFLMTRRLVGVLLGRCQSERANDLEVARRDRPERHAAAWSYS